MAFTIRLATPTGGFPPATVTGADGERPLKLLWVFLKALDEEHEESGLGAHGFRAPITVSIEETGGGSEGGGVQMMDLPQPPTDPTHEHDPIFAAIKLLDERKAAAGFGDRMADQDGARRAYLGLGIDFDELGMARAMIAYSLVQALQAEGPQDLIQLVTALWVDGLVTGILLEEHR